MTKGKKVFVGLSGGVDSALSAALLVRAGYDVTGVFIKIWQPEFVACTWKEDRLDAMRVAVSLGIPFLTLDLSNEYKESVIARMISDYKAGITPNPDVLCNRFIKFGAFREWALANGADMIATGHHAQVIERNGKFELLRGKDSGKDQAYFLCMLGQEDLSRTLFPIGHLAKSEVRAQARSLGLPVAKRPDSQGLCFVGAVDMHSFLKELIHPVLGNVLSPEGLVIGQHDGACLYTIGQRHGFKVSDPERAKVPQYVVAIRTGSNELIVAPEVVKATRTEVEITQITWTQGVNPDLTKHYEGEVRYHHEPIRCSLEDVGDGEFRVLFEQPVLAVPGQSLVLYEGDVCLGGGVIKQTLSS